MEKKVVKKGGVGFFGFGTILAIAISWHAYQSILWAILHGILSWFYVIYFTLTRNQYVAEVESTVVSIFS